ncbi:MAG: glycosyltransferase family 39 protein [Hyphomicrobiales bacterium]|nr:glycosyltransferase family 39 protein [Hyphomicrobiales bacterium]
MRQVAIPVSYAPQVAIGLLLFVAILACLRFINLDADFPLDATWSGVLFSDEGWYTNSAVRHFVYGQWYLDGDFNPIINMPLGQLVHRLSYSIFGLGLFSARVSAALCIVVAIAFTALIVRRHFGDWAGLLTAVILISNYQIFAFSRLAIMEPLGLSVAMAGIFLADQVRGKWAMLGLTAASLIVAAATLAKSSMLFAVPVIAYFAWANAENRRERIVFPLFCLGLTLLLIGGYQLIMQHFFSADYALFRRTNFDERHVIGVLGWLINLVRKLWQMLQLGVPFLAVAAVLIVAAGVVSASFRRSPLVHAFVIWGVVYYFMMTPVWYGPPRYFLPLLIPLSGLMAIATVEGTNWLREDRRYSRFTVVPAILVAFLVVTGTVRIVNYMANPSFSFLQMTKGVGDIIVRREGNLSNVIVFGDIADSVAIETGFRSMNTMLVTTPLVERLKDYHPRYLILHVHDKDVVSAVESVGGRVTEIGAWDVYENFYGDGQQVELVGVDWGEGAASPGPAR